jgi:selenocysteine lyase/cysteine desulfurase
MKATRRKVIQGFGGLTAATIAAGGVPGLRGNEQSPVPRRGTITLPDKASFRIEGTHLNAAYTHPLGAYPREALDRYFDSRVRNGERNWPIDNSRDEAVTLFADLVGAHPTEVAVVPSTLEGENLVAASLGLGPTAGVVTDAFHYDASLIMYGELHKRGVPLAVVAPRGNQIDYSDLAAAITPQTRLVAISLVASSTGYLHDLKAVCEIAHGKGALVYADVIQAVGAVPLNVKASGVDFCCAGMYKWLMGEFGAAFLYVRADRLSELKRTQVGWRPIVTYKPHYPPFDSPDPLIGDYELGTTTAQVFEVSTPNWSGLAAAVGALNYLHEIGVDRIVSHRTPLLRRLEAELPKHGFLPLTPAGAHGAYLVYSQDAIRQRFHQALKENEIFVTLSKNRIRISVSVYNDMDDIERLIRVLAG